MYAGGAGEGGGFLKCTAKPLQQTKARYLNIEHMIMMSLGQIELDLSDCANLEFHARTLYMYKK